MKKLLAACVLLAMAVPAQATIYNDSVNDVFTGAGGGILDIVSVEVTNDATDISFKFTLAGDVDATDWGKYMVAIDSVVGGDSAGNGWGRPISMSAGMDSWLGGWADSGNGMELYNWAGSWPFPPNEATWNGSTTISASKSGTMFTLTTTLANLGLGLGDSFLFDAFSSGGGGGDGAVDSLGNPNQNIGDWGEFSDATPLKYIVVPEPATLAFIGLAGLALIRRRR